MAETDKPARTVGIAELLSATGIGAMLNGRKTQVAAILMIAHAAYTLIYGDATGGTFDNPMGDSPQIAMVEGVLGGGLSFLRMGITKLQRAVDALRS